MARGDLMLRLYRFRDLPALRRLLKPEIFPAASGSQVKAFGSSASLWWWMRRTFQVFYVIEIDKREGRRMIGFAGVYNMEPRNSLWVSLVIFDQKDRRHGYGRRALELLLSSFQKNHVAKTVCGEVLASNTGSLRFLKKLGFHIFSQDGNRVLLKFEYPAACGGVRTCPSINGPFSDEQRSPRVSICGVRRRVRLNENPCAALLIEKIAHF